MTLPASVVFSRSIALGSVMALGLACHSEPAPAAPASSAGSAKSGTCQVPKVGAKAPDLTVPLVSGLEILAVSMDHADKKAEIPGGARTHGGAKFSIGWG